MDDAKISIAVLVPADRIAQIIGKAGAGLKHARERSHGCKLDVQKDSAETEVGPTRRITLIGMPDQIAVAFGVVAQKAFQDETNKSAPVMCTIFISSEKAGEVIGKGGNNLKYVQMMTGVQVKVERESVTNPVTGDPERQVILRGDLNYLGQAVGLAIGGGNSGPAPSARGAWMPNIVGGIPAPLPPQMAHGGRAPQMAGAWMMQTMQAAQPMLSNVRPVNTEDPEQVQLHMHINDKLVGAIVGKQGATIKETAQATGCQLSITDRSGGPRRVVIMGRYDACVNAQTAIFDQFREAATAAGIDVPTNIEVVFLIRTEVGGAVVGRQGATLTTIREKSPGVNIKLERDEIPGSGYRACNISGPFPTVLQAESFIHEVVKQAIFEGAGAEASGKRQIADGNATESSPKRPRAENYGASHGAGADAAGATTKMLVPGVAAGAVIGKQGAYLKYLRETYDVGVKMMKSEEAPQWSNERVVIVTGPAESRARTIISVLTMAFNENNTQSVLKLIIPDKSAGAIAGRQGSTLKRLREESGLNVKLERETVMALGGAQRLLHVQGSPDQVGPLVRMIIGILDDAAVGAQPTNGSGPPSPQSSSAASGGDGFGGFAPAYAPGGCGSGGYNAGGSGSGGYNSGGYNAFGASQSQDWEFGSPPPTYGTYPQQYFMS